MCGIFGWLPSAAYARADIPATAKKLLQALAHRGPDSSGWAAFGTDGALLGTERDATGLSGQDCALLLGQTRLAPGLSTDGHLPLHSPDGRYVLVYDGAIYNAPELRAELEAAGVRFTSQSDGEVVLHALMHWGTACLTRFTGMFALALYDAREKTLFCARDPFGIKPLYYYHGGMGFAFASELPALLEFPDIPRCLAAQQVYSYLRFSKYDMGGRSFFADIFRLPPAHSLVVDLKSGAVTEAERYWRPDLHQRSSLSFTDAARHVRELVLNSVSLHVRGAAPFGVALSGGIDSSSITCALRHLYPDAEPHAFSFIARGSPLSEEPWAKLVAEHTGAVRHVVEVEPRELARDMDALIRHLGEPFGSTSIYAQYRVFQLARECGFKVTLDGQGADELFAGYWGYPGQRMASLLLRGDILGAWRFLRAKAAWPGCSAGLILQRTLREFTPECLIPFGLHIIGTDTAPDWLDKEALREQRVLFTTLDERAALYPCRDRVRQVLAYQLTWEGLQGLLRHGDRNAMAHSIESRVPFLTREIAEFCLSLPEEYLIDMTGRTKSVFREAMRGIVPDTVLDRRDKIGFATPERDWLDALAPWVEEALSTARAIPYLKLGEARAEWRAIREGKKAFDWRVWRWLNSARWAELFRVEA
jgi:asparagine synthase (glutamine-hydrolysing)